jgi:transposase-like protein
MRGSGAPGFQEMAIAVKLASFYQRLNQILDEKKFDEYVETLCADFYAGEVGRPHFEDEVIILWVRWYLRYSLSYRDLKEMMAKRGLAVDHSTVWRWVQRYAPMLNQRLSRELRRRNRSWRVDETYIRVAGRWTYL